MEDQSFLEGVMANPYVLLIGFLLTLIGASSGLYRILKFLRSYGAGIFQWSIKRTIGQAVISAIDHMTESSSDLDGILSFYMSRLSDMILALSGFIFNIACTLYVSRFGLSPFLESPSWKFLAIPFFILIIINTIDFWIARFEIYIFRRAVPKIREKLAEKNDPTPPQRQPR